MLRFFYFLFLTVFKNSNLFFKHLTVKKYFFHPPTSFQHRRHTFTVKRGVSKAHNAENFPPHSRLRLQDELHMHRTL
jgi:hypothetical protein